MNNVLIINNSLSNKECDSLIKNSIPKLEGSLKKPWNYDYYDINEDNKTINNLSKNILKKYIKKYPEVNITWDKWSVGKFTFKQFKPGNFYDDFHSEQSIEDPRVLSTLVYLSDHNCGTEFYNGFTIKSVKGRAMVFPPYWTHAHKGQPCPDKKFRYILSAYATFERKNKNV